MAKVQDTPSEVRADHGDVLVEGPDGVTYAMTPDAAAKTSARLLEGAARAEGQRREMEEEGDRGTRH